MTKRGLYTAAGISLGVLTFVGLAALFEHFAGLKGDDWLRNILPFELATSPASLAVIAIGSLLGAWLLLRAAGLRAPPAGNVGSAMAQLTCCKDPSWVAGRDLGEAGGFDFLLGKCGACGAPWMNVFCTAASTSGYERVAVTDLAAIQSITDVNELKKFMRQWGDKNL